MAESTVRRQLRTIYERCKSVAQARRFVLVGLCATLVYFVVTVIAARKPLSLTPTDANIAGFIVSLTVSYLGHHGFTYQRSGDHVFFLARFVAASLALACLGSVATWWLASVLEIKQPIVAAIVAILYASASYILNSAWSFHKADPRWQ